MTGSGNDFVFIDGRVSPPLEWPRERIERVCARRMGVGADGLVILEPGSTEAAVRFNFFNSDGTRAEMCGNAALCATRLSARLGLFSTAELTLETDSGPVRARVIDGPGERAELVLGDVEGVTDPAIETMAGEDSIHFVRVGVPHLVVIVRDLSDPVADPSVRGRELRSHPALGDAGANVNFAACYGDRWQMRTYERGVEAETLACGTGAVSIAAALQHIGRERLPLDILTSRGCHLRVSGRPGGAGTGAMTHVSLIGEGRLVFTADLP